MSAEEVFEEATKLFGSGEKHVDMNESVSKQQFLPWPGLDVSLEPDDRNQKREREERGEENTFEMLAQVFKKKKKVEKSTT